MSQGASQEEAKFWAKTACREMGVTEVRVEFHGPKGNTAGSYHNGVVHLFGPVKINTVLHEVAHHVHEIRLGYQPKRFHAVGFHRICFEIRDTLRESYGVDFQDINGYHQTKGYQDALWEWFQAFKSRKGGRLTWDVVTA